MSLQKGSEQPRSAVGLGWSVCLLAAVLAAGVSEGATRKGDPGEVVGFDLARGRILEPLPFDVSFFLLTPVPADWQGGGERRAMLIPKRRRGDACGEERPEDLRVDTPCRDFPRPGSGACKLPLQTVRAKVNDTGNPVEQIEVTVPPLDARRDYCFGLSRIRRPDTAELERMINAITGVLAQEVRSFRSGQVMTRERTTVLCRRLDQAIQRAVGDEDLQVLPAEGTVAARCEGGDLLYWDLVLGNAVDNLNLALDRAVRELGNIALAIPDYTQDALLREIRGLDSAAARHAFLLGVATDQQAVPLTPEGADMRRGHVCDVRVHLKGLSSKTCSAVSIVSPPDARLACFAADALAELEGELDSLAISLGRTEAEREQFLEKRARAIAGQYHLAATTWDGFEGRFKWYVSADEGVAHAWDLGKTFSYTGLNVYTMPVNKRAPLSTFTLRESWRRRFAFMVGVSNSKIDVPGAQPHFEDRFVLLGGGVRLSDHIRFTAGVVVFDEVNPDPLIDAKLDETHTPFASLSVDVDVVSIVRGFFSSGGDS